MAAEVIPEVINPNRVFVPDVIDDKTTLDSLATGVAPEELLEIETGVHASEFKRVFSKPALRNTVITEWGPAKHRSDETIEGLSFSA